ncbi:hypothetical protein ACFCW6_13715 [Streptomyces sp. NPDC056333]|uniref:hypothetical protein n=1 Tax=Streptomyces sp. NPDC056333 TaxID=3345786 RepID=UPI0035E32C00
MKQAKAKLHDEISGLYDTKGALSIEIDRLFNQMNGLGRSNAHDWQERQDVKSRIGELKERRKRIGERITDIKRELDRIKQNLGPPGGGIYTPRRFS